MALDCFILPEGNVQIAFSGGRTSAYMLHEILEANGGIPEPRAQVGIEPGFVVLGIPTTSPREYGMNEMKGVCTEESQSAKLPASALEDLIRALETATGPDRELDARIAAAIEPERFDAPGFTPKRPIPPFYYDPGGGELVFEGGRGGFMDVRFFPRVTGSLDAALALAARHMTDCDIDIEIRPNVHDPLSADATIYGHGYGPHAEKNWSANRSAPLAICLALLRALQSTARDGEEG